MQGVVRCSRLPFERAQFRVWENSSAFQEGVLCLLQFGRPAAPEGQGEGLLRVFVSARESPTLPDAFYCPCTSCALPQLS